MAENVIRPSTSVFIPQELIDMLAQFAQRNTLRFTYIRESDPSVHHFRFQDQEQTWGYFREIDEVEYLSMHAGSAVEVADKIIDNLKRKVPNLV